MKLPYHSIRSLALALLFLNPLHACAETVSVAVAANFSAPMNAIAQEFTQDTGHQVQLSAGSSGKLYAQIRNGAPFEVFLSADSEIPARLEQEGLAVAGSRFTYATGGLALWSADPSLVDAQGRVLGENKFAKLAVADPKLAPYGKAAVDALTAMGHLGAVKDKFVTGENIGQTYQFVATRNAELGFVALSQIMKNGQLLSGSAWIVPPKLYAPIRQDAVVLNTGKNSAAAGALLTYLKGGKARKIMESYGYRR